MGVATEMADSTMAEALTAEEVAELVRVIENQKAEIARLRSEQSLFDVLREIAIDPACPHHVRLKAAEAGVIYERPKLSATVAMFGGIEGIGARLDRLNRRDTAAVLERRGMRVIEGDDAG